MDTFAANTEGDAHRLRPPQAKLRSQSHGQLQVVPRISRHSLHREQTSWSQGSQGVLAPQTADQIGVGQGANLGRGRRDSAVAASIRISEGVDGVFSVANFVSKTSPIRAEECGDLATGEASNPSCWSSACPSSSSSSGSLSLSSSSSWPRGEHHAASNSPIKSSLGLAQQAAKVGKRDSGSTQPKVHVKSARQKQARPRQCANVDVVDSAGSQHQQHPDFMSFSMETAQKYPFCSFWEDNSITDPQDLRDNLLERPVFPSARVVTIQENLLTTHIRAEASFANQFGQSTAPTQKLPRSLLTRGQNKDMSDAALEPSARLSSEFSGRLGGALTNPLLQEVRKLVSAVQQHTNKYMRQVTAMNREATRSYLILQAAQRRKLASVGTGAQKSKGANERQAMGSEHGSAATERPLFPSFMGSGIMEVLPGLPEMAHVQVSRCLRGQHASIQPVLTTLHSSAIPTRVSSTIGSSAAMPPNPHGDAQSCLMSTEGGENAGTIETDVPTASTTLELIPDYSCSSQSSQEAMGVELPGTNSAHEPHLSSITATAQNSASVASSGGSMQRPRAMKVTAKIMPLTLPVPRSTAWNGILSNFRVDDDPVLRYVHCVSP